MAYIVGMEVAVQPKAPKHQRPKLLHVTWIDVTSRALERGQPHELPEVDKSAVVETLGFEVYRTKEWLLLAADWAPSDGELSLTHRIPISWIKHLRVLSLPGQRASSTAKAR